MVTWLIFTKFAILCTLVWLKTTADAFFTETVSCFPNVYCCATLMNSNSFTREVKQTMIARFLCF